MRTFRIYWLGSSYLLLATTSALAIYCPGIFGFWIFLAAPLVFFAAVIGTGVLFLMICMRREKILGPKSISTLAGMSSMVVMFLLAPALSLYAFQSRKLALEALINASPVSKSTATLPGNWIDGPEDLNHYINSYQIVHSPSGQILGMFCICGSSALGHQWLYYDSRGNAPQRPYYRRLDRCWFGCAD